MYVGLQSVVFKGLDWLQLTSDIHCALSSARSLGSRVETKESLDWACNHISEAVRHFRFWLFQINCVTFLIFLLPLLRSPAMASLPPVDWFAMRAGLAASRLPLRNPAPAFRVHILHAYIHIEKRPPKNCGSEI